MLVPLIWQKDYVNIDKDLKEITDRLSETGSHVEEVTVKTSSLDTVVVGHVLEQEKHENADRLKVLTIDIGRSEPVTIITAAKNTKKGDYLFVITSGTKMDNGDVIEDHDFFGINSEGMLTSYAELGYPDNVIPKEFKDGVIILNEEFKPGTPVSDVLFSNTPVIEYEITPNRADCLSIIGMARESAASFGEKIKLPEIDFKTNGKDIKEIFDGLILYSDNCSKFITRAITNVRVEKSPQWLQNYLILAGMRPINNIVDITNFVMLETGQPLHAYDLDKLNGSITIREAYDKEIIKTIDGEERKLDESMLVIADNSGAIGIAGVMGGYDTEVTNETKNIVLESANFNPSSVRETSKKLKLRSEASTRFEKGVPIQMADFASRRVMHLIDKLGYGEIYDESYMVGVDEVEDKYVKLRISRLNSLTGVQFSKEEAIKNLELLEFEIEDIDEDTIRAKVPFFRSDIDLEADLIEEVVRLYGMGKIKSKPLYSNLQRGMRSKRRLLRDALRNALVGQKFMELATYSFISPKEYDRLLMGKNVSLREYIKILNPLGEDYSVMRTTQVPNMLDVISKNIKYGQTDMRFFEADRTFRKTDDKLPREDLTLTMGLYGCYDFYDLKSFFEEVMKNVGFSGFKYVPVENIRAFHKSRCAKIYLDNQEVGQIGQISYQVAEEYGIDKDVYVLEVNLSKFMDKRMVNKKYNPIGKFPAIERDYSFVVDKDSLSKNIEEIFITNSEGLIDKITIFDIYEGKGIEDNKKSISYSVYYRASDRTLKDSDIEKIEANILKQLEDKGISLRS